MIILSYLILIAPTGQESAASFSHVIFLTSAFTGFAFPSIILKPFGHKEAHAPQPMHFSWSTLIFTIFVETKLSL